MDNKEAVERMNDKEKADSLISITEIMLEHIHERRNHNWKLTLAIWASMAGIIGFIQENGDKFVNSVSEGNMEGITIEGYLGLAQNIIVILVFVYVAYLTSDNYRNARTYMLVNKAINKVIEIIGEEDLKTNEAQLSNNILIRSWQMMYHNSSLFLFFQSFITAMLLVVIILQIDLFLR